MKGVSKTHMPTCMIEMFVHLRPAEAQAASRLLDERRVKNPHANMYDRNVHLRPAEAQAASTARQARLRGRILLAFLCAEFPLP